MFKINSLKTYIKTILIFNVSIIFIQTLLVHLRSNQTETIRVKFGQSYCYLPLSGIEMTSLYTYFYTYFLTCHYEGTIVKVGGWNTWNTLFI